MKRSHQVTLVLLGSTALAGWQCSRAAPFSLAPQQVVEHPAQPGCDRGGGSASPGCGDARSLAQAPTGRSTATSSSGGDGGFFGLFHGGSGRAAAAHGAGW